MKLNEKKLRKLFSVRVSARKYNGWRKSPMFSKLGGLYGLMIGAKFMREITAKVLLRDILPYEVCERTLEDLKGKGYEIESKSVIRGGDKYHWEYATYYTVREFDGRTDDEIKARAKEFCKKLKEEISEEVMESLKTVIEELYEYRDIYDDVFDELEKIGVLRGGM
ncbi:hypothetical protein DRP04_15195 [Archaeoglobales archaeon]|nr:MAG: hypothetical protein DRP04_15195 [Archaeoglobales archaeon]